MEFSDHKQTHLSSSTIRQRRAELIIIISAELIIIISLIARKPSVTLSDGNADANAAEDPEGGGEESDLERRPGAGALPFPSLRHLLGHLRDDEEHAAWHESGRAAAGAQIRRNSAITQAAVEGV